jgi:hypothetical protein
MQRPFTSICPGGHVRALAATGHARHDSIANAKRRNPLWFIV